MTTDHVIDPYAAARAASARLLAALTAVEEAREYRDRTVAACLTAGLSYGAVASRLSAGMTPEQARAAGLSASNLRTIVREQRRIGKALDARS